MFDGATWRHRWVKVFVISAHAVEALIGPQACQVEHTNDEKQQLGTHVGHARIKKYRTNFGLSGGTFRFELQERRLRVCSVGSLHEVSLGPREKRK